MSVRAKVNNDAKKFDPRLQPVGKITFKLGLMRGFFDLTFTGGPYDAFRREGGDDFGVCVRAERCHDLQKDVFLPIRDFSVPDQPKHYIEHCLQQTLEAALERKTVYVGCMGGFGRTGLFLALLAKACGEPDPVGYVRANYCQRAVETPEQRTFVKDFDTSGVSTWLFWRAWGERWRRTLFWYE